MQRTKEVLLRELEQDGKAPFTSLHPVLDETCAPIAGPFEDAAQCKKACNAWSYEAGKQPGGTFRVRTDGTYAANMHRGPRFKMRCSFSRSDKLACPFKLVYEKAGDGKFYLQDANLNHHEDCRHPTLTAAESLALGDAFIPQDLLEFGVELKSYGASTGSVLDFITEKAQARGTPVTWRWDHLDRALSKALPGSKVNDMEGVVKWLGERQKKGLPYHIHTDAANRVDRIFYAMEGAQDMWDRSAGMKLGLFDTTHGLNAYGMKVGCVSTADHTGGVHILAVSIITRETGKAFRWVYDAFMETFGSEPDVLLTDGDLAMAAAAKMSFAKTRHHLCIWHLQENLLKHAVKLFPPRGSSPDMNRGPRRAFMQAFKDIMTKGGPGRVSPEEYFDLQWAKVEELAMADGALPLRATRPRPPPTSTSASAASDDPAPSTPPPSAPEDEAPDPVVAPQDGDAASPPLDPPDLSQDLAPRSFEEAYMSAEEEVNMDDEDLVEEKQKKRAAQRRKKSDATLVWEWFGHVRKMRERWAKVFTREVATRNTIMTNAAEALHSAIKLNAGQARRLLDMMMHIERRKAKLMRRKENKTATMEAVHEAKAQQSSVMLRHLRKKVSPHVMERLHVEFGKWQTFRCTEYKTEEVAEEVADGVEETPKKYLVYKEGTPAKHAVIATTESCYMRCDTNMGLPCVHVLRVHVKEDTEHLSLDRIHPFWREEKWRKWREGEILGEDEEAEDADVDEPVCAMPVAMDCDGDEDREDREADLIPNDQRFLAIMQLCRQLGELGRRSKDACQDVLDGVDELYDRLHLKHSVHADKNDAGVIDPNTGANVKNPRKPKKGKGRADLKRKKGARG